MLITLIFCFCACTHNKNDKLVKFNFVTSSDIAEFEFEKDEYKIGDTAIFTVTMVNKYSKSNIKVYANDTLVAKTNDKYTYKITVDEVKFEVKEYIINTYTYTCNQLEDFEIVTNTNSISHGSDFVFEVRSDKYSNFDVYVNDSLVSPNNNQKYVVSNVCADLVITINNYKIKYFDIVTNICDGVNILFDDIIDNKIEYNADLIFELKIEEGYYKTDEFKVRVNNTLCDELNGKYKVSNVTSNQNIEVVGVEITRLGITFLNSEGLTITSNDYVLYNDDFEFSFELLTGYEFQDDFDIKVKGESIYVPNQYSYVITNVKDDLEIVFSGISKIEYNITYDLPSGIGINLSKTKVNLGESVTFTISVLDGYELYSDIVVMVNGTEIYYDHDNVYTITNIDEHKNIVVTAETIPSAYYITSVGDGIEIVLVKKDDSEYTTEDIEWLDFYVTDEIKLNINILPGYKKQDNFTLISNTGDLNYNEDEDCYVLTNVTNDIEIYAEGLEYVGYIFNFDSSDEYDIEIVEEKDIYDVGDYFKFKVTLTDPTKNCKVYVNGIEVSPTGDTYIVEVIENDDCLYEITIEIQ